MGSRTSLASLRRVVAQEETFQRIFDARLAGNAMNDVAHGHELGIACLVPGDVLGLGVPALPIDFDDDLAQGEVGVEAINGFVVLGRDAVPREPIEGHLLGVSHFIAVASE